ncbi:MAG: class I SAM-dependent DNA methyltransferase, partial [Alloprevotella sp.]|nr:class I SAM-dependent DNA methyltransferase [Alloprevotella sp.]
MQLFDVLSTPPARRDPFLEPALAAFPYVNGGLFASNGAAPGSAGASPAPIAASAAKECGEASAGVPISAGETPAYPVKAPAPPAFPAHRILIPPISLRAKTLILERASAEFDWSEISPTIFGAVFESTLNPETRRAGGMHYTAIDNIHRVIDPLFLNDLRSEFAQILSEKVERKRRRQLDAFQERLASLRFLDPACGSGNFLTETYLSLRRLENEVIRERYRGQAFLGFEEVNPVKVSIRQFYGIEVNDFAVTVAKTALWISEAQMLAETEKIISRDLDFLPLKAYTNILEANALQTAWPKADYVIGNPPFVGARMMTAEQKQDVIDIFGKKWKNVGNLDYVCCWYKKAADLMQAHPLTRTAFVSTNSITQGEQVAALWKALPVSILFAHRTFRWDSEASLKAHVHCVIIGFAAALTGYAAPGSAGASPAPIAASAAKVSGEVPTKAMTLDAGEAPAL